VTAFAPWLNVFVDETGTADLDVVKDGVSPLFILAAVIVDEGQLQPAVGQMNRISSRLNSGAEIRSKKIGGDHRRRLAFLEAIQDVEFGFVALVVNKESVDGESGLSFKRSFHKYFHRVLETKLAQYGGGLRVSIDEHGSTEFMLGFEQYLNEHIGGTLFWGYEAQFVPSEESRLVQLADLVAGSLAYCFEKDKRCESTPRFRELLRAKQIDIWAWPPIERLEVPMPSTGRTSDVDSRLGAMAANRAVQFLENHRGDEGELVRAQVATLEMLLFARQFEEDAGRSIYGTELVRRLHARGLESVSEQVFRSQVVGRLRDAGIVIAGTGQGYRLSLSAADVADYLAHSQGIVLPMLSRIAAARRSILFDTASAYDILAPAEYSLIRAIVDCFGDVGLEAAVSGAIVGGASEDDEEVS